MPLQGHAPNNPAGTVFLVDLDGTLTATELLPLIAAELGVADEIARLTDLTMQGHLSFESSFIQRVEVLGSLPVDHVASIVSEVPLHQELLEWLCLNRENCWVVTGNLDCWVEPLLSRYGLRFFSSVAEVSNGQTSVAQVLSKETVLREFSGRKTVMVGDGANDAQIMDDADVGIGCALVHQVSPVILEVADWVVMSEGTLCRTLSQL